LYIRQTNIGKMNITVKKKIKELGSNNFINFVEWYESSEKTKTFEDYTGLALKEIYPNAEIYNMNKLNLIPNSIYQKHNLAHVDAGAGTRAGDWFVYDTYRKIIIDCKTKEDNSHSVSHKEVSNKYTAFLNLHNVNGFGIASDSIAELTPNTKKDISGIIHFDRNDLFNEDIYRRICDRLENKTDEIKGRLATLRPNKPYKNWSDNFSHLSFDKLKKEYTTLSQTVSNIRILDDGPAGSGKTEKAIVHYHGLFKKDYGTINVVEAHNTTVLKNFLNTFLADCHARNYNPEVILFSDKKFPVQFGDKNEEFFFNKYCKTLHNGLNFNKWLRNDPSHDRWIFVLTHNYTKLYNTLSTEEKQINFQFTDEVHHCIQPYWADWATSVIDNNNIIRVHWGASANKKEIKDFTGQSPDMNLHGTWHLKTLKCNEDMAIGFGWKRRTKIKVSVYDLLKLKSSTHLTNLITEILDDKNPYITLVGYGYAVPIAYLISADAILRYKIDHQDRRYMLGTLNKLDNAREFKKFFDFYRNLILPIMVADGILSKHSRIYKRLKNMVVKVADTNDYDTSKYLREVENIPNDAASYDALILHCRLLGEGWSPKNGWIDSGIFIDPAHSKIRIYQFNERGSRKFGAGYETNHMLIVKLVCGRNDQLGFNHVYKTLFEVGETLGIGEDMITEIETFLNSKKTRKKGGGGTKGGNPNTFLVDIDDVYQGYKKFIHDGRQYLHYDIAEECLNHLIKRTKELKNNHWMMFVDRTFYQTISNELYDRYKENFKNKEGFKGYFYSFRKGIHAPSLSKLATDAYMLREKFQQDHKDHDIPIIERVCKKEAESFTKTPKLWGSTIYRLIEKEITFDRSNTPGDRNFYYTRILGEYNINLESYIDKNKLKEKDILLEKRIAQDYYNMAVNALDKDSNYWRGFCDKLCKKHNVPPHKIWRATNKIKKDLVNNNEHWKKQKLKVYDLIFKEAETAVGMEEWIEKIKNRWEETNIQGCEFYGKIPGRFFQDYWSVLDMEQKEKLDTVSTEVSRRAYSRKQKGQTPWNKNIHNNKNSKKYKQWTNQVQKGRDLAKKKRIYIAAKRSRNPQ